MLILGIETSCDETAAAVVEDGKLVLSNIVSSQVALHAPYGGIVPEVAARNHVENIIPIIQKSLDNAGITLNEVDAIAVTKGPGLITSLLVGVDTAKSIAFAAGIKIIGINHLQAHVYAGQLAKNIDVESIDFKFPLIYLIASGGHTELVLMENYYTFKLIGSTRDDAAGEAFDKIAKLLELTYPGGPIISKRSDFGNSKAYTFARPMINEGYEFSFSGLKTDVLRLIKKKTGELSQQNINDICASFQAAVVDVLVAKTIRAAKNFNAEMIVIGGGVSANKLLRKTIDKKVKSELKNIKLIMPEMEYCTDNAAMIAAAGCYHAKAGIFDSWESIIVDPNLNIPPYEKL